MIGNLAKGVLGLTLPLILVCASACTGSAELSSGQTPPREKDVPGMQKLGDVPERGSSYSIQCTAEQSCWLNDAAKLWHSDDGGERWSLVYSLAAGQEVTGYRFVDRQTGWRLSTDDLYRTEDGGRNWQRQPTPLDAPHGQIYSVGLSKDSAVVWLAGGLYRPQTEEELRLGVPNNTKDATGKNVLEEAIFRSDDGGQTWKRQQLSPRSPGRILNVRFFDGSHGIASGEWNVYYTDNGGSSWKHPVFEKRCTQKEFLEEDYDARAVDVEMLDSELWWLSYSDGRIMSSADGGRTWCDLLLPGKVNFDEAGKKFFTILHFKSRQRGWALGWDKFLYETKDGGLTWTRVTSEIRFDHMYFLGNNDGLLVSTEGVFRILP